MVAESSPELPRARGRYWEAFAIFAGAALLLFGLETIPHFASSYVGAGQNDAKLYTWCLVWWPHAILSGIDPFLARVVYAPEGANMAWVTGIPGLALLTAPITLTAGPVVSSNILALLAPTMSGPCTPVGARTPPAGPGAGVAASPWAGGRWGRAVAWR